MGRPTAPALPNKPLLPESRRKAAEHPVPPSVLSQVLKTALPARDAGACTHQNHSETPRQGSAFSCCERRREEWGKVKPGEAAGLAVPPLPPTARRDGWVGRILHHLCISPSSLPAPLGQKAEGTARSASVWDTQTSQKPREEREDSAILSPLWGLVPGSHDCKWSPSTCWAPQTNLATTQPCHSRTISAPTIPQGSLASDWDMAMVGGFVPHRQFHSSQPKSRML